LGVELAAVTLEGAPVGLVAPLLEVVAKPNDWGKQMKVISQSTALSVGLYERFWFAWLAWPAPRHWTQPARVLPSLTCTCPQMEQALGEPLVFDALPTRKGCRIAVQRTGRESGRSSRRGAAASFASRRAGRRGAGGRCRGSSGNDRLWPWSTGGT
jgi:hypothetical protein